MPFPATNYPDSLDTPQTRTDNVDIVWDDDFNYHDAQIRKLQEMIGLNAELMGDRIAGKGFGGMVSPIASGLGNRAFQLAARSSFAAGDLLSVGDAYDAIYTEKLRLDYTGLLWALAGVDASAELRIPTSALPPPGIAGRLQVDPFDGMLKFDDGLAWNAVGSATAGSYLDWATGYQYTLAPVPVEEVIGQGYFDGALVLGSAKAYFRAVIDLTLALAGSCSVKFYDMGAVGTPAAPVLITTLTTIINGGPQVLEQELTVGVAPGGDQIANSPRMYEITVTMTGTAGDTTFVGSAGMDVR